MYKSKIINLEPAYSQVDNNQFIDLTVEFYKTVVTKVEGEEDKSEEVLTETKKFGYALGTTEEEILADLAKVCLAMEADEATTAKSAELDAQLTKVQELKNKLIPKEEAKAETEEEVK